MTWTLLPSSVRRRTVEPILGVLTVTLTAVWVTEPGLVFDSALAATIVDHIFIPTTLLVPGLLAVSVLARVVGRGTRLVLSYVRSDDRAQGYDINYLQIGTSLVFGGLAGYTLWWVIGSVYVITTADTGGVMLGPVVSLVTGSVLGLLLLARTILNSLKSPARESSVLRWG